MRKREEGGNHDEKEGVPWGHHVRDMGSEDGRSGEAFGAEEEEGNESEDQGGGCGMCGARTGSRYPLRCSPWWW